MLVLLHVGLIKINLVTLSCCSFGQYEASLEFASIRTYMYGLVVAGAYLADLSVGLTDDRAHRLRLLRIVDDFATKDGLITHARIRDH